MSPGVVPEMDLAGGYSGYSMGAAVAVLAAGALVAGARSLVARKLVVISRISQDQNLEWYSFCYVCYFFYFCYFCSLSLTLQETKESLAWHQVQLLASKGRLCRPGVLERCGWLGTCHSWVVCLKIMELRFAIIGQSRSRKKGLLIRSEMENLWRFKWILPQDMQFWTKCCFSQTVQTILRSFSHTLSLSPFSRSLSCRYLPCACSRLLARWHTDEQGRQRRQPPGDHWTRSSHSWLSFAKGWIRQLHWLPPRWHCNERSRTGGIWMVDCIGTGMKTGLDRRLREPAETLAQCTRNCIPAFCIGSGFAMSFPNRNRTVYNFPTSST